MKKILAILFLTLLSSFLVSANSVEVGVLDDSSGRAMITGGTLQGDDSEITIGENLLAYIFAFLIFVVLILIFVFKCIKKK